jgi:hypothetical protein
MNRRTKLKARTLSICLLLLCSHAADALAQSKPNEKAGGQQQQRTVAAPATPSDLVRAYYAALREARVRDAMLMSVLRPAIEALSASELEEFRPDFDRLVPTVPADFEITGEQVNAEEATVFVKTGEGKDLKIEPVYLIRNGGAWIIGDRDSAALVKKKGKKFLFEWRIDAHEGDAEDMLKRIQAAQVAYALRNAGSFGDLDALVRAGFVPQDVLGTETTGYRFTVTTDAGGRSFYARAEPATYGRSGRLSFYMDKSGIQKKDTGGKPLAPAKSK